MDKYETQFVETQALLAAQERDYLELNSIVAAMSPPERRRLESACGRLLEALRSPGLRRDRA